MTATLDREIPAPTIASAPEEPPAKRRMTRDEMMEVAAPALSAGAVVFLLFHLTQWNAPLGFVICWFLGFITIYGILVRQRHGVVEAKDKLATVSILGGAALALIPLFLIFFFVLSKGLQALFASFPHFLTHDMRGVRPTDPVRAAGMKHAIIGSLEQVGLATIVTVPIGVLAATYLNEVGGRFAAIVRTIADSMTGLPTIIAGLFVYSFWVKPRHTNGASGFAAAMALAIIMLPTIVRSAEEVLRIVSDNLREAALALGAPEWRMILKVVIPTARAGLVTASILGVARAVGETAPVLLTAFGTSSTNLNPFKGVQADLPLQIYDLIKLDLPNPRAEAWGGALLLVFIVLTLFTLARILSSLGPSK